ncbi:hypothetical protein [Psychrilyobacter atlanticus]|uniref:hypothetical protein n=1 Tax=Psychrilyobacter atlanticus TaxID=271091 RepID=UPI0004185517|nr:hypothetical protein [Psychrilyobacter atlanticus]
MIEIQVDRDGIASIKNALIEYAGTIKNREALNSDGYGGCLNLSFVGIDGSKLRVETISSEKVLKAFEGYWMYSYGGTTNEEIFFAIAMEYDELKDFILEVFKEIIDYAREVNDTSELWSDDDNNLIGLGSIYGFVRLYPEYTYLLGLYLIPYWDDEHAPFAIHAIQDLTMNMGISRDTLKLFCYSDNYEIRNQIFNNMTTWFRENKDEYEWFKETLKERFREYPFLPRHSDDEEVEHPVDEFYLSLISDRFDYETYEDGETTNFSDFFVYDNGDVEAGALETEILETTEKPLIYIAKKKEAMKKNSINPIIAWENFIINEFKFGVEIWSYIISDGDRDILRSTNDLYSKDLYELIHNSDYPVKKYIPSWCQNTKDLWENLDDFTEKVFTKFMYTYTQVYGDIILRLTDFLFELFDRRPFEENFIDELIDEYEVTDNETLQERYPVPIELLLKKNIKNYIKRSRTPYRGEILAVASLIEKIRESNERLVITTFEEILEGKVIDKIEVEELFEGSEYNPKITLKPQKTAKLIVLLADILKTDFKKDRDDGLTKFSRDLLEDNLIKIFVEGLEENLNYNHDKEIWSEIQEGIEKGKKNSWDKYGKILQKDEDNNFAGSNFNVYESREVGQKILQSIYLLAGEGIELKEKYKLILNFFMDGNPVKSINAISKLYRGRYNSDEIFDGMDSFVDKLKKIGISKVHILAWQGYFYNEECSKQSQQDFLDRLVRENMDLLEEVLSYLYEEIRFAYYKLLKKLHPELDFITKILFDTLKEFTLLNIVVIPEKECDNQSIELKKSQISEDIGRYFQGKSDFKVVEPHINSMKEEYFFETRSHYTIADAFLDMDSQLRKRFLNFYLRTKSDMYKVIFSRRYDNAVLKEIVALVIDLNLPLEPVLAEFIEDQNPESIRLLIQNLDIIETIRSYPDKKRLEAVNVLTKDRYFRKYLKHFENDKSRRIKDLVKDYFRY